MIIKKDTKNGGFKIEGMSRGKLIAVLNAFEELEQETGGLTQLKCEVKEIVKEALKTIE